MERCKWVTNKPLYIKYHDEEWGVPVYDDRKLFEMLCLEGAQAGLSWWSILQRRENYQKAFDNFEAEVIALYKEDKVEELMNNKGIIRNRRKIQSFIQNAQAFIRIKEQHGSFTTYIWNYVNGESISNKWTLQSEVPATTPLSEKMSKQLKKDGFSFVGPTICYSFMQAVGMVNDHISSCFCSTKVSE